MAMMTGWQNMESARKSLEYKFTYAAFLLFWGFASVMLILLSFKQ